MKFKTNISLSMMVCAGLLTAGGSALAQTLGGVYAQGDLIVGFTVGSGNDLIANLGPASTVLVNGNSWNFGNLLTNVNGGSLAGVSWGVIGDHSGPNKVYSTNPTKPVTVPSGVAFNQIDTALNGFGNNLTNASGFITPPATAPGDGSWNIGTIVGGPNTFKNVYGNPNVNPPITTLPSGINFFTTTVGTSTTNIVLTGSFSLSSAGVLSFSTSPLSVAPPPPQIVSITRSGNNSTVIFTTTNGSFTYSLFYTNATGLTAPMSTWPSSATTVTGTGVTNSITDTTTDAIRFYRVGVH